MPSSCACVVQCRGRPSTRPTCRRSCSSSCRPAVWTPPGATARTSIERVLGVCAPVGARCDSDTIAARSTGSKWRRRMSGRAPQIRSPFWTPSVAVWAQAQPSEMGSGQADASYRNPRELPKGCDSMRPGEASHVESCETQSASRLAWAVPMPMRARLDRTCAGGPHVEGCGSAANSFQQWGRG